MSSLSCEGTLGLLTTLHFLPFQCRVSVCSGTPLLEKFPTAHTSLAEMLATPKSPLPAPGFGLLTTVQGAACAWATADDSSRAISTVATTHEKSLTLKRFMMFLTVSCSRR